MEASVKTENFQTNQLEIIIKESGLGLPKAEIMRRSFEGFFRDVAVWEVRSRELTVTDENQTDLMEKAKDARIFLRNIRLGAEETRKSLKKQILIEGRALDGIVNVLKGLIVPLEDFLEKQEKFTQIREAARIEERKAKRLMFLDDITPSMFPIMDDSIFFLITTMDDAQFEVYAGGLKLKHDQKVEADRKATAEADAARIAKEAEDKRIREENERLKKEAEEKDRAAADERRKNDEKLAKERADKEKAEKELQAKKDAEEAEKKTEAARKRKERTAPDRDKLLAFADMLLTLRPVKLQSIEAQEIEKQSLELLRKTSDYIKKQVKSSDL